MDAAGVGRGRRFRQPARFDERRFLRLLGLSPATADPVRIITAAQIRLRRWRRSAELTQPSRQLCERIQRITEARDALLARRAAPAVGVGSEARGSPST